MKAHAQEFDALFALAKQREGFRQYLEALLVPSERNRTLTALVNFEPIEGTQAARVQALQWFLSESTWDATAVNTARLGLLQAEPTTTPDEKCVLVIDEHGDRTWASSTWALAAA